MTTPKPTIDLTNRAALITGAGVGIGAAIARTLGAAGATIGVHCNQSVNDAEAVIADIIGAGGKATLLQADLTDPVAAARIVEEMHAFAGRLDILINNAGSPVERTRIEECSLELWQQIVNTNLTSAFVVTKQAIPHLRAGGNGVIVNNLTLSIQTGGANGAGPYAIAKGGLQVMTRTLARELAPEIRTLSIMPGVIETRHHEVFNTPERMQQYRDETPLGHNGTPDDVANTVLFLVSDQASFLNGSLVDINGGRFLR